MTWLTVQFMFLCLCTRVQALCKPKHMDFEHYWVIMKRSQLYRFEIETERCQKDLDVFYYDWEVVTEKLQIVPGLYSNAPFLTMDGYKIPMDLTPIFSTRIGIHVKISHYSDFKPFLHDAFYFEYVPEPLHVRIRGGSMRTHSVSRKLILDGKSESFDPSYAPGEDAFQGNSVLWTVAPPLNIVPPKSLIWEIPPRFFKAGQTYTFTLQMNRTKLERGNSSDQAQQTITFMDKGPGLIIECLRNCMFPHPQRFTLFKATCSHNCPNSKYAWYSTPQVLVKGKMDFGDGTNKLLIHPNVATPGQSYTFGCKLGNAQASYNMTFIKNIEAGKCGIIPKEGYAGVTSFFIACFYFHSQYADHEDVLYEVYQGDPKNYDSVMLHYGWNSKEIYLYLSEGWDTVTVTATDPYMTETTFVISGITVKPLASSMEGKKLEDIIKYYVLDDGPRTMKSLLLQNDHSGLVQIASALLTSMNGSDIPSSTKSDLMFHMSKTLHEINMGYMLVAEQIMSVMWKLFRTKEETDTRTTLMQAKIMKKVAKELYLYGTNPREFVTFTFVKDFSQKMLALFSDMVAEVEKLVSVMEHEVPPHDYDTYDEMDSEKIVVRLDYAEVFHELLESLEYISKTVFPMLTVDQQPLMLDSKSLTLSARRLTPALLSDIKTHFVFSKDLIQDLGSRYESIDYQYVHFKINPFWWHTKHDILNTEYVAFDIFHKDDKIENLKGHTDIVLKVLQNKSPEENVITGTLGTEKLAVYRLETMPNTLLRIEFSQSSNLKILLQHCPPTLGDVKEKGNMTNELMYSSQENEERTMFLGILNDGQEEVTYKGTMGNYLCLTWDQKSRDFVGEGLTVAAVRNGSIVCRSSHFSMLGGMFGVPPNKIEVPVDLDIVLFIHDNFVMLVVLISVFLFWFFLMVWAFIRDRRLARKNVVFLLPDTVPGDQYGYLIVVVTGLQFDAGTTANVCFQLVGTQAESRPHLIKCNIYEPLQRGNEDWFVIYCPEYLGAVTKLRLWHNCRGRRPHWYCQRVIVQELKSGTQFCFIVERWFSLVWGDSEVSREIPVTYEGDVKYSKFLFPVTVDRGFRDGHLWLSIFSSPPQSNFTTKERVTVAIALLLLSMLASGMFYGIPKGDASDAIFSQGSYYITNREIFILLESLAVNVPAAFILVILFKKTAPPPMGTKSTKRKKDRPRRRKKA